MSLRRKILLAFISIVAVTFTMFAFWAKDEIQEVHAQVVEDLMVDMSQVLAASVEQELKASRNQEDSTQAIAAVFKAYKERKFHAKILDRVKDDPSLDIYITDNAGKVLYSSRDESEIGRDYSKWNDVYRTLKGQYGARSTRVDPKEDSSSVYYIAAPIYRAGEIAGVVSVIKPRLSLKTLLQRSSENLAFGAVLAASAICVFGGILVLLITGPIDRLRTYALKISEGGKVAPPELPHRELKALSDAFEKMRISLEGKKSIESYTQSLTHEMKSPLTVIRGGAELCLEPMPVEQREKFLRNIIAESARAELILQTLLQVAALETQSKLESIRRIPLVGIVRSAEESLMSLREKSGLKIVTDIPENLTVSGDEFLLTQSLRNVLQNAIEFSKPGSSIFISAEDLKGRVRIQVRDEGVGIPAFAQEKVFEKFFSLERPATGKKGSGLGLTFVREVALLHKGEIDIRSVEGQGTEVTITLPS